jgi:hypothetical protein
VDWIVREAPPFVLFAGWMAGCGVAGFFLMRWHGLTGNARAFAAGGFFYVVARTSFVVVAAALVAQAASRAWALGVPHSLDEWRAIGFQCMFVLIFSFGVLSNLMVLGMNVFQNQYGAAKAVR